MDDKYRASYGVSVESHPRQCIIVGSTNAESGFLRDITGNRRFWPIPVSGNSRKKAWQITKDEVAQIWAETLVLYRRGEKLYLEGEDAVLAVTEQADAMEADEREGLVRGYLDTLLPENWDELDLYEQDEMAVVSELMQAHIKKNASVAQSQEAYALEAGRIEKRYNAAFEHYTALETEKEKRMRKGKEIGTFITTLKKQPMTVLLIVRFFSPKKLFFSQIKLRCC